MKTFLAAALCALPLFFISCGKQVQENELSEFNPVTFTFYSADMDGYTLFNDPVAKEITRKTGVTLELVPPKASNMQDIPTMIDSGKYCDLIYAKSEISKLIDADALVALDDWISPTGEHVNLIEKYGYNMKAMYGDQLVHLRHSDGHIYTFGTYEVKKAVTETAGILQIQHAVLKELGYPRLTTLDDFEAALKAYIKKHPTFNDMPTIGFSIVTDDWHWYVGLSNPGNYVIGYPDDGQWIVDRKTHKAVYKFLVPEMKLFYKWLNRLYNEGLLDPESFTQDEAVWTSKLISGRVLGTASPDWQLKDPQKVLAAESLDDRTYAYLPIVASPEYKDPSLTDYGYSGGWGISISKQCKNVELAFQFMNWMCSEEAQILTNWGIEGVNYVVKNGKRTIPPEEQEKIDTDPQYQKNTGVGQWVYPFPERGSGAVDKNGDWITRNSRERIVENYLPVERETLSAYGATMWTDLFPQPDELPKPEHGQIWQYNLPADVNILVSAADEYTYKSLVECIIGKEEDFDSSWEKMVEKLKDMGMEQAGEKVSALIKEKLILWGRISPNE